MVRSADLLVYLDDVQFTRRDWRNRNLIASSGGPKWLTIPLQNSGNYYSRVNEMRCSEREWWRSHLSLLDNSYGDLEEYKVLRRELSAVLKSVDNVHSLSEINRIINKWVFSVLGITAKTMDSRDFPSRHRKSERLVEICKSIGVTEYVSGPAARDYLDEDLFAKNSITVHWADYGRLPSLSQAAAHDRELSILHHLATVGRPETVRLSTFVPTGP